MVFSTRFSKDCLKNVQAQIGTAVKKTEWSVEQSRVEAR
jgi:hypothetical protein